MPHDEKITRYIGKTLIHFVEIYFVTHCHTVSIFLLYFLCSYLIHFILKIYCLRNYFMLIIVRLKQHWPTTASMLCTKTKWPTIV